MENDLRWWITSELHQILGYSDTTVVNYVISLTKKYKNQNLIVEKLVQLDFPDTELTKNFAKDLISKFQIEAVKETSSQSQVKSEAQLRKDALKYKVLPESTARPYESVKPNKKRRKVDEKLTTQEKHLEEFHKFIDDAKHLPNSAPVSKPAEIGEEEALDKKALLIPDLREISRQEYLKKREEQERKLLKSHIEDEMELFSGVSMTEVEKKKLELDKKIWEVAEKRKDASERAKTDFYNLPDAYETGSGKLDLKRRDKVLEKVAERYKDDEKVVSEQEEWEKRQKHMSDVQIGSNSELKNEYDLVFDEVKFVAREIVKGNLEGSDEEDDLSYNVNGKKLSATQRRLEREKIIQMMTLDEQRKQLPIFKLKEEFRKVVEKNQVTIVVGQTGSGKTTQIPQYLYEFGYCKAQESVKSENGEEKGKPTVLKIGITQPRRVAAMSVAARVAVEQNTKLGHKVGYLIRFEDHTSPQTIIKYLTDGMLFRELLSEPDLKSYSCIMIDEAHERTVFSDVLLVLLKDLIKFRPELKVIISSATMDASKFSHYFNDAPIFNIPGRMYPVEIRYTKQPEADYLEAAVVTVLQIHITQELGDILVFFTGQEEIEAAKEMLLKRTRGLGSKIKELVICPIYSNLPSDEQEKVFLPAPANGRKVILATNIAETSLTINGIRYVVDTGFCKQTSYNPKTGMESLIVTPISQAQAEQRTGRAGRVSAGKCFRLYTKWSYTHEMDPSTVPEIQRTNLSGTVLLLKSLGVDDLINFEWLDPPPGEMLLRALEMLYALGALNEKGELTRLGRRMAEFPTDPQLAKTILAAEKLQCVEEILTICAMLDVNASIFYRPLEKKVHADTAIANFALGVGAHGDHMQLYNVYQQWQASEYSINWCYENYVQEKSMKRAREIRDQLNKLCDRVEVEKVQNSADAFNSVNIRKAILSGFFYHTARLQKDGSYKTVKNSYSVAIHPSSTLFKVQMMPRWLVYHTLQFTKREFMRSVAVIEPDWLLEIAPHFYKSKELEDGTTKKMPKLNLKNSSAGTKDRVTRDGIFY